MYRPTPRNNSECIAFTQDKDGNLIQKCTTEAIHSAPDDNNGDGDRKIYCELHYKNLTENNMEFFTCSHFGAPNPMNPSHPIRQIGQNPNCGKVEKCRYDNTTNPGTYICENTGKTVVNNSPIPTVTGRGGKSPYPGSRPGSRQVGFTASTKPGSPVAQQPGAPVGRGYTAGVEGASVPGFGVPDLNPGNYRECKKKNEGKIKYSDTTQKPASPKSKKGSYRVEPDYIRSCTLPEIDFTKSLINNLRIIDTSSSYKTVTAALQSVVTEIRNLNLDKSIGYAYNFDVEEEVANEVAAYLHDYMDNGYRIELVLSWLFSYESRDLNQKYSFFGIKVGGETDSNKKIKDDVKNESKIKEIGDLIPKEELVTKEALYLKVLNSYTEQGVWYGLADYFMSKKKVGSTSAAGKGGRDEDRIKKADELTTQLTKADEVVKEYLRKERENGNTIPEELKDLENYIGKQLTSLGSESTDSNIRAKIKAYESIREKIDKYKMEGAGDLKSVSGIESGGGAPRPSDLFPKKDGKEIMKLFTKYDYNEVRKLINEVYGKIEGEDKQKFIDKLKDIKNNDNQAAALKSLIYVNKGNNLEIKDYFNKGNAARNESVKDYEKSGGGGSPQRQGGGGQQQNKSAAAGNTKVNPPKIGGRTSGERRS